MISITLVGKYSLKIRILFFSKTLSGDVEEIWRFKPKWSGVRSIDLPGPFDALVSLENERIIFSLKLKDLTLYQTSASLKDMVDGELPISLNKRGLRFEGKLIVKAD